MKQFGFRDEERYGLVKKFFGEPPCSGCLKQAMCFGMVTNSDDGYLDPEYIHHCPEADEWFYYGTELGYLFDFFDEQFITDKLLKGQKDRKEVIKKLRAEFIKRMSSCRKKS